MKTLTEPAYAKINLSLDVLGRRADGYHDLKMVMQSVSLCDRVTMTLGETEGLTLSTNLGFLPVDEKNIAVMAARAFARHTGVGLDTLSIHIDKKIPVCAGTAGGSSDGAAVLRGLNRLYDTGLAPEQLAKIGEEVGSDVPYCVLGGTALARGRGEILTPLPSLPPCHIVLCKPAFSISTPALFRAWDKKKRRLRPDTNGMLEALAQGDLVGVGRRMFNVFEGVLNPQQRREIESIKNALIQAGALGAAMSGSGPTVLGLFDREDLAGEAVRQLRKTYDEVFLTQPV